MSGERMLLCHVWKKDEFLGAVVTRNSSKLLPFKKRRRGIVVEVIGTAALGHKNMVSLVGREARQR